MTVAVLASKLLRHDYCCCLESGAGLNGICTPPFVSVELRLGACPGVLLVLAGYPGRLLGLLPPLSPALWEAWSFLTISLLGAEIELAAIGISPLLGVTPPGVVAEDVAPDDLPKSDLSNACVVGERGGCRCDFRLFFSIISTAHIFISTGVRLAA